MSCRVNLRIKMFFLMVLTILVCRQLYGQSDTRSLILKAYASTSEEEIVTQYPILKGIPNDSIVLQSDSIKYLYHYCLAGALINVDGDTIELMKHIEAALYLRESSIGIQNSEYLELLWAKGSELETRSPLQAIRALQKGVVVGMDLQRKGDWKSKYWYGKIISYLGDCYVKRNYITQAISLFRESFSITSEFYEEGDESSWLPLLQLEQLYYEKGDYNQSVSVCDEIIEYLKKHNGQNTEQYAMALRLKANALRETGQLSPSIECYEIALNISRELGDLTEIPELYSNLFLTLVEAGEYAKADTLENDFLAILRKEDRQIEMVNCYYTASNTLVEKDDFKRAEEYINKCDAFLENLSASAKETIYSQKCKLHLRLNDIEGAKRYKELAIANSTHAVVKLNNRVDLAYLISMQDKGKGIEEYAQTMQEIESQNLDTMYIYTRAFQELTSIYYQAEEYTKGIEILHSVKERYTSKYGSNLPVYAAICNLIGVGHLKLKNASHALPLFEEARNIYEKLNNQEYSIVIHNLGRSYMLLGDKPKARQFLEKSRELQLSIIGSVMDNTLQYLNELNAAE